MLTLDEAASFLGTNESSIYSLIYSGAVHSTKHESDGLMVCVHTLWTTRTVEADDETALSLTRQSSE
jgi:hypothetical protein